tara:strand:- start:1735 stop:2448 length:714 start_codon:yes stop_codon:yes gene_type:complete
MSSLILIRHGQSTWNLEKRFTGWVDVDLTEQGKIEAKKAGLLIKSQNINIDFYYSSFQLRANNTLEIIQNVLEAKKDYVRAWQLNERHYGELTGLNKIETAKKMGEDKVFKFRRSWDIKPGKLSQESSYHPLNIETYKKIPKEFIPDTESLKDTFNRVLDYFNKEMRPKLIDKNVLITAHGNSIRALCKYLFNLDNDQIMSLEIPTGNPLVIKLSENLKIHECRYLDKERSKDLLIF